MCEENKDVSVELTDEAVAEATGGDDDMVVHTGEAWCSMCHYIQRYGPDNFKKNCPACGHPYF